MCVDLSIIYVFIIIGVICLIIVGIIIIMCCVSSLCNTQWPFM